MPPARPPGRPRDPAIDETIRAATRELLRETGPRGLSMAAVAARAGISKPTLYLRHPNKSALIFDAVFGGSTSLALPDNGTLRADLLQVYGWAVAEFASPEIRAALPALLAETSAGPELRRHLRAQVLDPEYARVEGLLQRARARGEIRDDVDLTLVVDVFVGTVLVRATIVDRPLDDEFARRTVDLLLDGLRPRE